MQKYKVSVSKGLKKYTIVVSAKNESEARKKVHNEWYSILEVQELNDENFIWKRFIFEVQDVRNNSKKNGLVIAKDILKVYIKLRDELHYKVLFLYTEEDKNLKEVEKLKILHSLEEQYFALKKIRNKKEQEEKLINKKSFLWEEKSFHMKKELEETHKLIEFVLKKMRNIIENSQFYNINPIQKEKLKEIYNSIVKIKKSTNITKLRQIGENALIKIGSIELNKLEENKTKESKTLLSETNKLLRQVWSNKQFIEKNKDISYLFELFFENIRETINNFKELRYIIVPKKEFVDKKSYSYMKTIILLRKYKTKQKYNNKNIQKNIFKIIFPFWKNKEEKEHLFLKRKVIKQNISLLKAKASWKIYSYTLIKKGYEKILSYFFSFVSLLSKTSFTIIFLYSLVFVLYLELSYFLDIKLSFNYLWIFYFIITLILFLVLYFSRTLLSLFFNIVIFSFIFIFWVVNF